MCPSWIHTHIHTKPTHSYPRIQKAIMTFNLNRKTPIPLTNLKGS